jgi:hypothetical protein
VRTTRETFKEERPLREESSTSVGAGRFRGRDVALGLAVNGFRTGAGLVRLGLLPVRVAARVPVAGLPLRRAAATLGTDGQNARLQAGRQLDAAADRALASPELAGAVDRLLASPLVEAAARSLVARRVVERAVDQVLREALPDEVTPLPGASQQALVAPPADTSLEHLARTVLGSPAVLRLTDEVLRSAEMQRLVQHVAESPEVRRAITRQTASFADEVATSVRSRTESMDTTAETTVRAWLRRPPRDASG